jgi:hypothetical protein
VQPKVTAPKTTKENTAENKQGKVYDAFIKVTNRNKKKQTTTKQKMIAKTTNADKMERANRLLQSTDHESDYKENSKADQDTHQSNYKTGNTRQRFQNCPKQRRRKIIT